jgi:hypothetical protein
MDGGVTGELRMPAMQYLYHGSPALAAWLEPRPGRGVGSGTDRLCAVYASPDPLFAIPFALPIVPEENGRCDWTLSFCGDAPIIEIWSGYLDLSGTGYVYRVRREGFERLDEWQWVSYTEVEPVDYAAIDPHDYVGWIAHGQVRASEGVRS